MLIFRLIILIYDKSPPVYEPFNPAVSCEIVAAQLRLCRGFAVSVRNSDAISKNDQIRVPFDRKLLYFEMIVALIVRGNLSRDVDPRRGIRY